MVTGGYAHWVTLTLVLTLNVETETVHRFSMPPSMILECIFMPMGNNLSYVSTSSKFLWDVWEMNSVTGEWTMLFRIETKPFISRIKVKPDEFISVFTSNDGTLVPFCWLVAGEILVISFRNCQSSAVAYNVKTGEVQSFEWEDCRKSYRFIPHVNSFIWCGYNRFMR